MRYYVALAVWYQGDFEKACAKVKEDIGTLGGGAKLNLIHSFVSFEHNEIVEADSREQAKAQAKAKVNVDWDRIDKRFSLTTVAAIPYITIRELLDAPVVHTTNDVYVVLRYFREIDDFYLNYEALERNPRARIDYICRMCFDGRRTMSLGVVYFDNEPVMVFQNAGREGRDHEASWIISKQRKREMTNWLITCVDSPDTETETPLDKEILELSVFYGQSIVDALETTRKGK